MAKRNAAKIGKFNPKDGNVSVHVDAVDADVPSGTDGLKHGLRRTKDIRTNLNAIVTLQAGKIIKNSIRINELIPSKQNASGSFVLIGSARDGDGHLYIVRSVINPFELGSMDVLYAINAKKGNRLRLIRPDPRQCRFLLPIPPKGIWLRSMRPGFQGPVTSPLLVYPLCWILSTSIFPTFCRRRCSSTTDARHGRRAIRDDRHCIPHATSPTGSWMKNTGSLYEQKEESKRFPVITDE